MAAEADAASATTPGVVASSSPLRLPRPSHLPTTQPPPPPGVLSTAPLPLQMAPPAAAFLPSSYAHAMRVEGAIINLNVRMAMNGSNYTLWRGLMLEVIDCATLLARRFQLTTELFAIRQGDSPVSSFCAHLKGVTDALCDVGKVLDDDELIIQLLRSTNKDRHQTTTKLIEKSPNPVSFDVAVGMLLHDEIDADYSGVSSHSALAIHNKPPSSAGAASGSLARSPLTPGSGGGKPGSPSPNQGHNKCGRYTNNGGYHDVAASMPPWTGSKHTKVESEKNQLQLEYNALKKVLEDKDQVLPKLKEKSEADEQKLADFSKLVDENAKMKKE
ncbi:hypothetical protein D1007_04804 [Hordeum vulgare]|nr:hypothetical protein D1007_04804 [Hordeum vulgare]